MINPGTLISYVRMTDDVISDCVGGDYIIIKIEKNEEIYGATSLKGMGPGISRSRSNESLECLLCCVRIFWPDIIPNKI